MIVKFKFNKEEDLKNIWETCNAKPSWGVDFKKSVTSNILEICENKKFKDCKKRLEQELSGVKGLNEKIKNFEKKIRISWKKIENQYFKTLEKITGKKFKIKKVTGFLTTSGRCPYDYNIKNALFFVNIFNSISAGLLTAGHELMHIHFHNTDYKKIQNKIGKEKTENLKEALTVLLNIEFNSLWKNIDKGYPHHKKLRKFIEKEWKKEKDFEKLLIKCVDYLK